MKLKIVYIAHPIAGAIKNNISRIEKIVEHIFLSTSRIYPIAPYLHACEYLNDNQLLAREMGLAFDKRCIESGLIDELWVCGAVSEGVQKEINWAVSQGINVIFKDFSDL